MTSLFLAWTASACHAGYPIGRLDIIASNRYVFQYTKGMLKAQHDHGFPALPAFPDLWRKYQSVELFPLLQNRVMNPKRRDFADYLTSLGLSEPDPIAMLAISGGERETDNLAVFPKIKKQADGRFVCRFFVQGWRDLSPTDIARALALTEGERLTVCIERADLNTGSVIRLMNVDRQLVGWAPRYLADELANVAFDGATALEARVVRVNRDETFPPDRRVLVELAGRLAQGVEPMTSAPFQCIGAQHCGRHCRNGDAGACGLADPPVTSSVASRPQGARGRLFSKSV